MPRTVRRGRRRMKGGFYGFGGDVLGTGGASGAAMWSRGAEVTSDGFGGRGGNSAVHLDKPFAGTQSGAGRRRRRGGGQPSNPQVPEMKGAQGGIQTQSMPQSGGTPTGPALGGKRRSHRRRRASRRHHSRRRKMRGGTKFGATYGSYDTPGPRGMYNLSPGSHVGPGGAGGGAFNDFGAKPHTGNFKELMPVV